jgi:hypothetical protein
MRCGVCLGQAIRAPTPIGNLGFVDLVTLVVGSGEARGRADCTVDVDDTAADTTDQMVVVVADPIFEAGRRSRWLNTANKAFLDQDAKCVVHGLKRDGADLCPDNLGNTVGRDVGPAGDGAQNGETLGRDLNTALPQELRRIGNHAG